MWADPQARLLWFRRLALIGAALAATVVVLGAWVRLTNAGLGCPDWPGCYGHVSPVGASEPISAAEDAIRVHPFAKPRLLLL